MVCEQTKRACMVHALFYRIESKGRLKIVFQTAFLSNRDDSVK
ncbi:hypothetical protein NEISUBOT_04845 [Neisseria subflava NJ9703]|uniref:Uncharacterized protein n=1 Tax=Neisseria subflava NJ9703 TaxID=546268 RepID=A0A9W5MYQ5_NEISU|nr:hypothetical protein NEISUBOT_04845 [Neisseria subflava NJ9703]